MTRSVVLFLAALAGAVACEPAERSDGLTSVRLSVRNGDDVERYFDAALVILNERDVIVERRWFVRAQPIPSGEMRSEVVHVPAGYKVLVGVSGYSLRQPMWTRYEKLWFSDGGPIACTLMFSSVAQVQFQASGCP